MNVHDMWTSPDWATFTIAWAQWEALIEQHYGRDIPASHTADLVWETFAGDFATYADNTPEIARPIPNYPTVFTIPLYGFTVGLGSQRQGIIVQLSGAWWNLVGSKEAIRRAKAQGFKCTRWDEALTMLVDDPDGRPALDIAVHYRRLERETNGHDLRWHHPRMEPGEETWYCGSRKSGRFARVYDKPEFNADGLQAVRVEVEYKRQWAPSMMDAWFDTGAIDLRVMSAFLIGNCKGDDHPAIALSMKGLPDSPMPKPVPQPLANRPKWFHDQIQKAWMNWADEDPRSAIVWALLLVDGVTSHGLPDFWARLDELESLARINLGLSE